jgi:hypothetical protein
MIGRVKYIHTSCSLENRPTTTDRRPPKPIFTIGGVPQAHEHSSENTTADGGVACNGGRPPKPIFTIGGVPQAHEHSYENGD